MINEEKKSFLQQAIKWIQKKPITNLRSVAEGYEDPRSFYHKQSKADIKPDITIETPRGIKHYTEIAMKSENPQILVTKWKLLSMLAAMKRGNLYLLAPKGHKLFTQRLVKKYNINALVYSL